MLGKLLKYEMKDTAGVFLPMFGGFLIIALLCRFSMVFNTSMASNSRIFDMLTGVFFIIYYIYVVAMFVLTIVYLVIHFCKTMGGDQGYLTHTLPVRMSAVLNSKLIAAVLWQIAAMFIFLLTLFIFAAGYVTQEDIKYVLNELQSFFHGASQYINLPMIMVSLVICLIAQLIINPLQFYTAYAVGHLFRKHRMLFSVITYLGINVVIQILSTIILGVTTINQLPDEQTFMGLSSLFHVYMGYVTVLGVGSVILFYCITNRIFSRHLNLN